jgi:xanthine/CO dehydrogenase XdhC/CoxF family maturation factor
MTTRLQVLLDDDEYREIQQAAAAEHLTVAAWVRRALADVRRHQALGNAHDKLAAVREAAQCQYPTASIDVMLSEIESGYGTHDGP